MEKLCFDNKKEYVVEEVISEKDNAVLRVVLARDTQFNRRVILKEITYENRQQKDGILYEIKNQVFLENHTNLTPIIYNVFVNEKKRIITIEMQKMPGKTLREILSANISKTKNEKWYRGNYICFTAICKSVAEMHKAPYFVHKDLKPENIVMKRDTAYIIDFGISGPGMSKGIGTPAYMAPEQHPGVTKFDVCQATDVFALGQIGVEIFTGAPLIYGEEIVYDTRKNTWLKEKDLSGIGSTAYPKLASILNKAIAMDPADRYANAGKLVEALRNRGRDDRHGR